MKNNRNEQAEQTETKAKRWKDKEKSDKKNGRTDYERKQEEKCVARKKKYRDIQNKTSGVCS